MSDAREAAQGGPAHPAVPSPSGRRSELSGAVSTARAEALAAHPFLAGMDADRLAALADLAVPVRLPAGTRLFTEGGAAERFWLIESGQVALDIQLPGRGAVLVETLGAGQVLGWSWLEPPYRWHFGAATRATTDAFEFDADAVRERCDVDPALGYALLRRFLPVVVNRLQASRIRLLDLYAPGAQAR